MLPSPRLRLLSKSELREAYLGQLLGNLPSYFGRSVQGTIIDVQSNSPALAPRELPVEWGRSSPARSPGMWKVAPKPALNARTWTEIWAPPFAWKLGQIGPKLPSRRPPEPQGKVINRCRCSNNLGKRVCAKRKSRTTPEQLRRHLEAGHVSLCVTENRGLLNRSWPSSAKFLSAYAQPDDPTGTQT